MHPQCPVVGRRPQHAVSTSAYIALSSAKWYPSFHYLSSSSLHFLAGLLLDRFPSYGLQVVIRNVHRLYRVILMYPTQVHFCLLTLLICHCWKYVRIIWLFKKCPMSLLEMFGECDAVILLCISLSWCLSLHVLYSCPGLLAPELIRLYCTIKT